MRLPFLFYNLSCAIGNNENMFSLILQMDYLHLDFHVPMALSTTQRVGLWALL